MALLARALAVAALLLAALGVSARAQDVEVPVSVQLPLFLKVMSFDRRLATRTTSPVVIAIAYQGGFRMSIDARNDALKAAQGVASVGGMSLTVVVIDLDREDLERALSRNRVTLLYVAPLRGVDIGDIIAVTRAARVTTLSGVPRYVEQGCAVGVRLQGDRPRIVVNLSASRLEGAEFGAELLKLAQVL
jgi:hypothetical protein